LSADVLALAGPTAQAPQALAEGLYDLVSSGFDAREALTIMGFSANAATAGLTDAAVSTKVVAAVLNAYRLPAEEARNVSDQLFRTVDRGVITFEELAQNIGDTLPFAASLGVSLTEVGAATATMTKQGLGAPETMTRIRNLLQTMIKPGEGLKKAFKELGVESGETLIKQKGFLGALEAVIATTDGSKKAVAKLFPNIRALGGALALTGNNSKSAAADLKGMQGASGATARALEQQSKSASFQWNRFKANISVLAIELANGFLPTLNDVSDWLGKVARSFRDLSPEQKKFIVIAALAIGVLGPLLILFGAIAAAGAALATTAGLVTLGIFALAAGAVWAYTKFEWFRQGVALLWELMKHSPAGLLIRHFGAVVDFFKSIPGTIKSAWIGAINYMIDRMNDIIGIVNTAINAFNKLPGPDIGTVGEIGHIGGPAAPRSFGTDYGGFNPLTGRPMAPTGPTPFGGTRTGKRPLDRRRGAAGASTAATASTPSEEHIHLHMDGKEVTKVVRRRGTRAKAVS
jgi:TP901 family phage tail tape measure protein